MAERLSITCNNCKNFSLTSADGSLVGAYKIGETTTNLGYCRAPYGALLGVLKEVTECKKPAFFAEKPKKDVQKVLS